uniref:Uncharacterized protein n=1 Tax=Rhizophora mucronata TaxID=61149 RepID=A0A2P2QFK6_RHIMU
MEEKERSMLLVHSYFQIALLIGIDLSSPPFHKETNFSSIKLSA